MHDHRPVRKYSMWSGTHTVLHLLVAHEVVDRHHMVGVAQTE
jgi:hypothetical protein